MESARKRERAGRQEAGRDAEAASVCCSLLY